MHPRARSAGVRDFNLCGRRVWSNVAAALSRSSASKSSNSTAANATTASKAIWQAYFPRGRKNIPAFAPECRPTVRATERFEAATAS